MNEIKKCSIAGVSFTLEKNAYETLQAYIKSLHDTYKDNPDGEEIIADIEARIAELILSTQPADAIIAKPLIDNIIKQLGSAEEIDEEGAEHHAETTDQNGNPRIPRRLYRDLQHGKLGGVCAGIANYFDIDPSLVRLAFFIPVLLSIFGGSLDFLRWLTPLAGNITGVAVLGYIVMWFTVPPASSARQKLEMRGERITARNIHETTHIAIDERERTLLAKIMMAVGRLTLIFLKVIALFFLIILVVGISVLGLVAIATTPELIATDFFTGLAMACLFVVIIVPILILTYLTILLLISRRPSGKAMLVMFVIWLLALAMMTVSAIKSPVHFDRQIENAFESVFENDRDKLYEEFSQQEIDEFRERIDNMQVSVKQEGDITVTLQGAEEQLEKLEATLKINEKGVTISDMDGNLVEVTPSGIKIDGKEFVNYTTETIESVNGTTKAFIFSIGDVKVRFEKGDQLNKAINRQEMINKEVQSTIKEVRQEANEAVKEAHEAVKEAHEAVKEAHGVIKEAQNAIQ